MKNSNRFNAEARSILDSLRRVVRALRVYSREAEKRTGLSAAQCFVLQQLGPGEAVTLKELAARTMTDLSSVSVVVERLQSKGLLARKRSAEDGRALEIRLTVKGAASLKRRPDALQARLIQAAASLKPSRRRALAEGLHAWLDAAGLAGERPPMFFEAEEK